MEKPDKKQIRYSLYIGIIGLVVFLGAFPLSRYLYNRKAEDVNKAYEVLEARAVGKHVSNSVKGGRNHWIYAVTPDGHEKSYWVRKEVYESVEPGEIFLVYKYEGYYESALSTLISSAAGAGYKLAQITAIVAFSYAAAFTGLAAIRGLKGRRRHRRRGRRRRRYRA